ncbi:MAG TPA: HlyD family efflux transporter periplasmic adaptor subunit, partial [Pirellulaceae bacterium]|nr:HlyD family efflux transporter periplasmic adaptor subunit [Pirellulaceae bacterium]
MRDKNSNPVVQRKGISAIMVIASAVFCLVITGGFYFMFAGRGERDTITPMLTVVKSGEFVSQVLDQGEIQSSENVEIRCRVRARNGTVNVIEVVPEGTRVKSGDFLVRLDATSFEKELEQQKIAVANAQTAVIQSNAAWRAAEASKKEYTEGLFVEQKKTIENQIYEAKAAIETARQEHSQAVAALHHSEIMQSKGFITFQQLAADKFAVEKALVNLKKAENSEALALKKLEVLELITLEKELVRLTSDIESAYVKLKNSEESLKVEEDRLADIQQQIANCYVVVPPGVEGQVVYGKESSRGGTEWALEEGAAVRENQVLMRLPNPKKMEVKALINEQSITSIRVGMPATIKVDALNSQTLKGIVTKVNQYAEQAGWSMSSQIRKYAVFVRIFDPPEELKPGMNASVNIQVQYQQEGLLVPLQAVYGVGDEKYCLVKAGPKKWETRKIVAGG